MSASSDSDLRSNIAHRFEINWYVIFGGIGIIGSVIAFLYNILIVSENNQVQIQTFQQNMTQLQSQVSSEFQNIQQHLDTMEHTIGRIEGRIDGTLPPRGFTNN